jgi:hypothetical protein
MSALFLASLASHVLFLVICVLLFFACGVGLTVVMISESGTRGTRSLASYVTASDFGSATGPMLGWMTQQMHMSTDWIFLMGGGLYAAGLLMSMVKFR